MRPRTPLKSRELDCTRRRRPALQEPPYPAFLRACPGNGRRSRAASRLQTQAPPALWTAQAPERSLTSLVARYGPGPTMRCSMARTPLRLRPDPARADPREPAAPQFELRAGALRALIGRWGGT